MATTTSITPKQAAARARRQSERGPQFGEGECQMRNRLLYDVPSDGTPTAAAGWTRSKHRHPTTDPSTAPLGAFHRWLGGSHGAGHVALSLGGSSCWSTDILRTGYFDRTTVEHINAAWHLTYVGWTTDIDGVVCAPEVKVKGK